MLSWKDELLFLRAGTSQQKNCSCGWGFWLCPQASHTHDAISEAAQLMKEAVDDIMVTLNEAASEGGMVGGMVESIAEAMGIVSYSRVWECMCVIIYAIQLVQSDVILMFIYAPNGLKGKVRWNPQWVRWRARPSLWLSLVR